MGFNYFITGFFDEDEKLQIDTCYFISKKNYCYKKVYIDGDLVLYKRISEKEYISAYEAYMNY